MEQDMAIETYRSLAQLENEMKKAEAGFLKADARLSETEADLKKAEAQFRDARQKREAALAALNECHADIDRTVVMLREASPAGCRWKEQSDHTAAASGEPIHGEPPAAASDFILRH